MAEAEVEALDLSILGVDQARKEAALVLQDLDKKDIKYMSYIQRPPKVLQLVMEAMCLIMDVEPKRYPELAARGQRDLDYWVNGKSKLLCNQAFPQQLRVLDPAAVPQRVKDVLLNLFLPLPLLAPRNVLAFNYGALVFLRWMTVLARCPSITPCDVTNCPSITQ